MNLGTVKMHTDAPARAAAEMFSGARVYVRARYLFGAQKADVVRHVAVFALDLIAEYTEVETGKRDTEVTPPELDIR
ncbi:MAG: hypothetical protein NVSMB64_14380 [Candidatus Velthaea sp.]